MSNQKINHRKIPVAISNVTFKGGLRNIISKYTRSIASYKEPEKWCQLALARVAEVWVSACTGSKSENLCLKGDSIRSIRNVLAHHIGDSELLYVMNSYIYGVINTGSLDDALRITEDYEKYISGNSTLTALQKDILLQGFAAAKYTAKRIR